MNLYQGPHPTQKKYQILRGEGDGGKGEGEKQWRIGELREISELFPTFALQCSASHPYTFTERHALELEKGRGYSI